MNKHKNNKKPKGGRKKEISNKENKFQRYSSRLVIEETSVSLTPEKEELQTNETEQIFAVKKEPYIEATDNASINQPNKSKGNNKKLQNGSKKDSTFQRYSARLIIEEDPIHVSDPFTSVKEEPQTEETAIQDVEEETDVDSSDNDIPLESSKSALRSLYEGHKVKDEMVIGPEEVQTARPVLNDLNQKPTSKATGTANNISVQKKEHGNDEIGADDRTCPVCSKTFTLKSNCQRHISTVHEYKRNIYPCNECPRHYSRKEYLKTHTLTHRHKESKRRRYKCQLCGKEFNDESNRNRHRKRCSNDSSKTPKPKIYVCDYCNKSYANKTDLSRHILSHSGIKQYSCRICSKQFTRSNNLKYHMDIHDGKRDHKCKICFKTFTRRWCLVQHMHIHDKLKTKRCSCCEKLFYSSTLLRQHELFCNETIFRQKPLSCDVCMKRFADKSTLAHHVGINHLVRFTCDHCKKSFGTKKRLSAHMNLHSDKFTCKICGKIFGNNTSLMKHKPSHSGTRSYTCELCGKSFKYFPNLYQHKMVVHKGTD